MPKLIWEIFVLKYWLSFPKIEKRTNNLIVLKIAQKIHLEVFFLIGIIILLITHWRKMGVN